ncbi:tripartite motif-containing protein 66 [Mytilus galloprovincialis]|uniref:Tripartite motif-containing protein 66 n=1 Tax=Mytilus galloprovincialis TaxID=29158 RepID=A0A8B6F9K9_MYTGA|nr:tripartite motif-containing protein 66 [Mytilus galloprovincialis]
MAFSQSIKRGQAPATCNLCKMETKIKWKCINCDVIMCDKCKDKIHVKLKLASDHTVIDIKRIGTYRESPDFSNLICEIHTDQSCVLFCTTCDTLVCTWCINIIHNGHGFIQVSEGYKSKIEKVQNEQTKAKEKIKELMKGKGPVDHDNVTDNKQYKDLIRKIEARNIEIKKSADKYAEELKSELKRKWEKQDKATTIVDNIVDNLKKLISNAEDIIQSKEVKKVFTECEKLSTEVSIDDIDPGTISFLPGQMSPYNVGSLQVVSNTVNVRIVKQFQTDISKVGYLSLSPDNSLWISDQDVIQKVKPVEHKLTVESTFNIEVYGMAVNPTGDLLLSSGGSVLKQISGTTGKLTDSIYNVDPLVYSAVHVTKDDKVIVGVKSSGKPFPVTGRRAIFVMNQKGEHETIYEHNKNNIRIFACVKSITSTDNGNICVVDKLSEDGRGKVVVLNREGDILQIYTGHHEVNNEKKPFKPVNIVTIPSDNIIVAELNVYIFHILNNCGHLITHINMGDIGISKSYSLCFTRTAGQMYIGCTTRVGSSEKAKLYEVNISGC